jgi:hypothetical protein
MLEILERIDHRKTVSILSEMLKISTENPPGNEETLCSYIDEKCRSTDLETEIGVFPG